jgi:hypothetical protein
MELYSKLLVARYSPKNGCNVPEGVVLTIQPRKNVSTKKDTGHRFVSRLDKSSTSKYGWVAEVGPFTIDEFIQRHLRAEAVSENEREHIRVMLSSIASLPIDTPVAARYSVQGVIERKAVFVVHKVFFYHPRTPPNPHRGQVKSDGQ